jgi:hypothetical protein
MDWSVNTIQFLALKEVHDIFKAGETHTSKCHVLYTEAED